MYKVRLAPRSLVICVFAGLGRLSFFFVRKEREKTIKNLKIAYGETKTDKEIKVMAKKVFVNLALAFADYLHTIKFLRKEQFSKIIDFEGIEHLEQAYKEGRGVLCMTGHLSSWEFSAIMPPILGFETSALSRQMKNKKIDDLIVSYRQKRGMKNIGRGSKYPQLIEVLKKGECLIIMTDQDTKTKGVFVNFFGKPAYTPLGVARLAFDSKAVVVPMFMIRKPDKKYCFKILPPVPFIDTGNLEHDLYENTRIHTEIYEKMIAQYPEQWVWMHERWKTTPEEVERFLENKRKTAMNNES
ncbi:MAG: lysophospholipid acyltransferase family protein [Marinilabiliaceae bacterium]|nr:lysophospholipid acyltransferase family protein [Marinilabiliaceae bacterium]